MAANFDFCGYATKNDLQCSDGRVIRHGAFKENDGRTVPLVWQHSHDNPENVLGHALLEDRSDGVYAYGFLNHSQSATHAKEMLANGDINAMSIYANKLAQKGADVIHGNIVEVSLVLSGANPGALIDTIAFQHSDGSYTEDEAIIYSGDEIVHSDEDDTKEDPKAETKPEESTKDESSEETIAHAGSTTPASADQKDKPSDAKQASAPEKEDSMADNSEETVKDIFDTLTDKQKDVVYFMIGQAIQDAGQDTTTKEDQVAHSNIFEGEAFDGNSTELAHSAFVEAAKDAKSHNLSSVKEAFLEHAATYGIENIELLFPDAQAIGDPDWIKRQDDWVAGVLNGAHHSPFSRIKSVQADVTADSARALGYVKGNKKKEEVFKLLKRVTTPTTIYKKQKLDRDDVVDITDLDVVAWMKGEMRGMLNEEIARAVLIGDGRDFASDDKIDEEHVRPIWKDDDLYSIKVQVDASATTEDVINAVIRGFEDYEGKGVPTLYTTRKVVTDMLLLQDKIGRRLYDTKASLAAALGVSNIVEVPVMKGATRHDETLNADVNLLGIIVNIGDYNIGADKGGEVNLFDDFDIDYNQMKYLMETRISGALVHPKTAIVLEQKAA